MSTHPTNPGHAHNETADGSCGGHGANPEALARTGAEDVAECPVMTGTTVIKAEAEAAGLVRHHRGQRYWLCCDACGPLFDADPERYIA
ncbi:hypothetical protein [Aeromicrobium sp. CTD01-1L150]|uniref:hypothetical protein n=1 Tax=Aeromicrobium sp. CTD01-1L150 TaxID=3341830 RepID=UPI0035C1E87F